ncbi:MAG: YggS family pyridoxal phosphate-dependent enzyme [Planctomycetes bacterium]|nr:YggS family pyridoxal phosphate-dependent enzyme [Planctomycetota bacterium]
MQRTIAENLAGVRGRIAEAARRAGRQADEVTLVAVTKYVGAEAARALVSLGCQDLGESRPQTLWPKAESLRGSPVRWHMIGHLQRNKVKRTLPLVDCIHSADSVRLLDTLEEEARNLDRAIRVLLEVNVSGDVEKHGFARDEVFALAPRLADWPHVEIRGLMAMSGRWSGPEAARSEFARLRHLRDAMRANGPAHIDLGCLSMGMSDDFELAVEEGATLVRIGSALFEGVPE